MSTETSTRDASRPIPVTRYPSARRRSATALPIPVPAPVTTTCLSTDAMVRRMRAMATTARSANQAPPLEGWNLFAANRPLVEGLRREGGCAWPELAAEWEPALTSLVYDPELRPLDAKMGALCGMAMTERQGGSDVRANETVARPLGGTEYELHGSKWFCSAPMCDAFLVLAHAPAGLTCFLVSRVLPDGTRNGFRIDRLKDKLGNRSNASSEIQLD